MRALAIGTADVESAIAAAAARCLRAPGAFDLDTPFALLGIDSLATIEMTAALEDLLALELPPELLLECENGRALAGRIAQRHAAGRSAALADPHEQMLRDAVLPHDVRPAALPPSSTDLRQARRILLTGSTGFLGKALLDELLESTEAEIVCLVRDSPAHSRPRRGTGINGSTRIHLFTGDLARAGLGLTQAQLRALATGVDAVLHCGAAVNWVYPYAALRAPNVLGTLEMLRLACRGGIPFHFVSSISACYSSAGPAVADESYDALPHLRGVRLGYAQTKIVAEALVSEAGRRGLPVRIYRPSLISGESDSGAYNRDDMISALVRGCVHMGTAPDLDWNLDCQPVDIVAKAIVHLSKEHGQIFHLGHSRPRHWRECVLWMRMYGYPLRLVPYHTWLRQLDRETSAAAPGGSSHPLRPLRSFFLDRHHDARGLTLPELHEEGRRTRATSERTIAHLAGAGVVLPRLDAALLDTYFSAFRANGDLPAPAVPSSNRRLPGAPLHPSPDLLSRILRRGVVDVHVLDSGSEHSIISELTAWRSQQTSGLFHLDVGLDGGSRLDLRLKVKAADDDVIAVGEALAELVDPAVGQAYERWSDRVGFTASSVREIEVYRQTDHRFTRHSPALLGHLSDDVTRTWMAALENVGDARLPDAARVGWNADDIGVAIDGLAALHSIWHGREGELRGKPWIGYVQSSEGMASMADLWTALAHHAAPAFSSWGQPDIASLQERLIAEIPRWWPYLEAGPRTLIHYDFNPRNVCLRTAPDADPRSGKMMRLCAYDWELATIGAPQRDLAEFLCFVLSDDVTAEEIQRWIDCHRMALERETGSSIDPGTWQRGFRAGLYDFMVNRLGIYALVHRVRRQPFLPRVVRAWRRIYDHFPLEGGGE